MLIPMMIITTGEIERSRLAPITEDLRAAAHVASLGFGEGGDLPTEAENITLKRVLGEKKPKH